MTKIPRKSNRILPKKESQMVRTIRGAFNRNVRNPILGANLDVNRVIDKNVLIVAKKLLDKKVITPRQAAKIRTAVSVVPYNMDYRDKHGKEMNRLRSQLPELKAHKTMHETMMQAINQYDSSPKKSQRLMGRAKRLSGALAEHEKTLTRNYRTARTAAKITPLGALIATMIASRDSDTPSSKSAGVKKRALPFHSSPPSFPNTRHPVSRSGKYMTKRAIKKASLGNFTPMNAMSESDNQNPSSPFDFPFLGSKKNSAEYSMNPSAYAASQSALKNTTSPSLSQRFPKNSSTPQAPVYSPQDLNDAMLEKIVEAVNQTYTVQDKINAQKQYYEDLVNAAKAAREQANAYTPTQPSFSDPSNPYDTSSGIDWLNDPSYYDPSYYQEPVQPFIPEYKLVYGSNRPAKSKTPTLPKTSTLPKQFRPDGSKPK